MAGGEKKHYMGLFTPVPLRTHYHIWLAKKPPDDFVHVGFCISYYDKETFASFKNGRGGIKALGGNEYEIPWV